jgi:endonuclease G
MKRSISALLSVFLLINALFAQTVDVVVDKGIYKSHYSRTLSVPLYVEYELYRGGGSVSRRGMKFEEGYGTAKNKDYRKSGYDKGHLVPAEDFAFDSYKEQQTFSYYNCFPQTPKLNRGAWKVWEATIRSESQKWPLKIYTGGIYGSRKLNNKVAIPDYCWKVVFNQQTGRLMHVLLFTNDDIGSVQRLTVAQLKERLGYPVPF